MADTDRTPLDAKRSAFAQARNARLAAQAALARTNNDLAALQRTLPAGDPKLQAERADAIRQQVAVQEARAAENAASVAVTSALGAWLSDDPAQDIARLEAQTPIILLPLRIETRFIEGQQQLLVRIYPDEISADAHEPDLSDAEIADGAAYWGATQPDGEQLADWQQLLQKYPSQRAAWIVRMTDPALATKPASFGKPSGWSRAVEARLLPDRFMVIAERGTSTTMVTRRVVGKPVVEPLALSVGPDTLASDQSAIGPDGSFKLDDAVQWTVDFDLAETAGMAIRLGLEAQDFQLGFDRVIVLGIKASLDAQSSATQLGELFDAQHFTQGLAFVSQGSPTSNVAGTPAAFPPPDDNNVQSFAVERGAALDGQPDCAGGNLSLALGLPAGIFSHVAGADLQELAPARAMNRVLYPATFGYFLDQVMAPLVPPDAVNGVGDHFATWVVPRGMSSAFRIGRVPYGVLPVTSLALWQERRGATEEHREMVKLLQGLRGNWVSGATSAPHVGANPDDPDKDLLDVLAMDASTRQVRVRRVIGQDTYANLLDLLSLPRTTWENQHRLLGAFALNAAGIPVVGTNPRVLGMNYSVNAQPYHGTIVELADALSETAGLKFNYIDWVRGASIPQLKAEQLPAAFSGDVKQILLYRLLRHCALAEYHWWAGQLIATYPVVASTPGTKVDIAWREPELVKIIPGTENDQTPFDRLTNMVKLPQTGQIAIDQFLSTDSEELKSLTGVGDFRMALETLQSLPSAELQRLATESLDICSHRLDAWIGSLANERLWQDRSFGDFTPGCFVGAYGFVENLKPEQARYAPTANRARMRTSTGGYVHAPSMAHAMTAAVLRNAYMTHVSASDSPYAIDLSSKQARMGRYLLDSVRNGQPLGAVLGYLIERALHEAKAESLIAPIRNVAPLVANKIEDSGEPAETVAARNVVDGLALWTKWKAGTLFDAGGLSPTIAHRDILEKQLGNLDRNVDAVADLLLSESVHQVVLGSTMASGAGLDALAQGTRPPDPSVGRGQTGGTTFTHRVAVVFADAVPAPVAGWSAEPTPRAACEPRLDAWIGSLLGSPANVRCRVQYEDNASITQTVTISLDQLGLRPLDVIALAKVVATTPAASELDRRVLRAAFPGGAPNDASDTTAFNILYAADGAWDPATTRTVPELLDLANAIGRTVGAGRALVPVDVVLPQAATGATADATFANDVDARVAASFDALTAAHAALAAAIAAMPTDPATPPTAAQTEALRAALRTIADFGLSAAFPPFPVGDQEGSVASLTLLQQAEGVFTEAERRLAAYGTVNDAIGRATAIFGRDFKVMTGFQFGGTTGAELAEALGYGPQLVAGDQWATDRWFTGAARVREPLGRWRMQQMLAEASGAAVTGWNLAQLPHDPSASWAGLPPQPDEERKSGVMSLVLNGAIGAIDFSQPSYGLFLDEWTETIPNASEHTGITFRHDDTGAEAPQTILVAVNPTNEPNWTYDALLAIVNETIDLVKIRAVDLEQLDPLLQVTPGIFLAANAGDSTISTIIGQMLDPTIAIRRA